MKTLAIFGDSYGRSGGYDIAEKDWVDFIRATGEFKVTNFSVGGSSLWYSYDLFLKHKDSFDKVIFLVTSPGRLWITSPLAKIAPFQNYNVKIKAELASGIEKKQYQTIVDYYELIHDNDLEDIRHQLMVENIGRLRSDTIVYPCFPTPYIDDVGLYEITKFEDLHLGLTQNTKDKFYREGRRDSRTCHMTEENNKIVADLFLQRLNNRVHKLDISKLIKPKNKLEYYFQTVYTIDEINTNTRKQRT
jgi:hypothetical protein